MTLIEISLETNIWNNLRFIGLDDFAKDSDGFG